MRVFIDIGHPAHVHYFKYFIKHMENKGHIIKISARDKEITFDLLNFYKFPYLNRGKGKKGFLGKLFYMLIADILLIKEALKFKPDLFLSFGSPYAAQAAWFLRKPHIAFDDTDHNMFSHLMYVPFTKTIVTPAVYQKDYKKKHVRFNGFMELCSLHPYRLNIETDLPHDTISDKNNRYVVLRFISWEASHDWGLKGLTMEDKYLLVKELSKYVTVIISSESPLPADFQEYAYKTHPAYMHSLLKGAELFIGESATMAAESAFLGTPSICITTQQAGTIDEENKLGFIELFRESKGLIERAIEIIKENFKENFKEKSKKLIKDKIDVTGFMIWFIENYPESFSIMKKNPDYQNNFK